MVRKCKNAPERLAFLEALEAEPERVRAMPLQRAKRIAYVDRGFYARQLKRLWHHIPREQTIAFKSEELQGLPETALARIAEFLGVSAFPPLREKTAHAAEDATT